jgi:tetratricopeptide (TPR) repeat protein
VHLQRGEIDDALRTYEQSVETSRRARHADGLVQSLRAHGEVLFGLGRNADALPRLQEAARLFAQLGDSQGEVEMLASIAVLHERVASASDAIQTWQEVRRLRVQLGDARGELEALDGIVRMQRRVGVPRSEVTPNLEDGLALAAKLADRRREASLRNTLGILEWEDGRYAAALRHYERFLVLARELEDRGCEGLALNSVGVTLSRMNRHEEARTVLEESIALNEATGEARLQAHALGALADVYRASGRIEAAAECRARAEKLRSSNATLHH